MTVIINGSTGITNVNGTAAAPAETGTDTDSGIVYGTNTVSLATNGTTAVTVDSSQNVGIGTSSPGSILDVQSATSIIRNTATTGTNQVAIRQGNTGGYFYTGIDTSTGGYLTGAAYAGFHWMSGAYPMIFATNNSERMRIDSSGNVGVGTTAPYAKIHATGTIKVATGNAQGILALGDGNGTTVNCGIWRGAANAPTSDGNYLNLGGYDGIVFATGNAAIGSQTERARITTNNFLVNTTTTFDVTAGAFTQLSGQCAVYNSGTTNTLMSFYNASQSARVGFIGSSGNTTSYNSGSDYRLKENITNVSNAISKIEALRPVTFNWKVSPQVGKVTGFIAHELAEIYPEAVTGEKDAMCDDGVTPNYQMVDQSKLVPLLTAAIQEQQTLITALTARITALENT